MPRKAKAVAPVDPNAAPAPKLTRREKLVVKYNDLAAKHTALTAALTALAAEINGIDRLANVLEGTAVFITIGKGDKAKEVEGVVAGVRDEEDGSKTYKVTYGTGFDADVAVVKAGALRLPTTEQPAAA